MTAQWDSEWQVNSDRGLKLYANKRFIANTSDSSHADPLNSWKFWKSCVVEYAIVPDPLASVSSRSLPPAILLGLAR